MALPGPRGNRLRRLFPRVLVRVLRGLRRRMTRARQAASYQPLSSRLISLSNALNGTWLELGRRRKTRQLFNSGLIFFSNSSIEVSPLIFSPLTKKVGVESTFSTSLAYFWSA